VETNPLHETGHWSRLGVPRRHGEVNMPEKPNDEIPEIGEAARLYSIREMARDFKISIRTLRFYEDRGLLHPRREGINRRYDARDRLHLKMILKGKSLGFTLSEIAGILAGQPENSGRMNLEMSLMPEQIIAQIEFLERQRHQIDEAIKILRRTYQRTLGTPLRSRGTDPVE
jgi:DNA-binding transcriptional MerR regulator